MHDFEPGSYVSHRRLPDLGIGEVLTSDESVVSIRFASGNRQFLKTLAATHLVRESEAPELPKPKSPARARRTAANKAPKAPTKAP